MSRTRQKNRKGRIGPGFIAIIVFKYFKGALFLVVGIVALRLMRLPEMEPAGEVARFFGVGPENEIVRHLARVLGNMTPQQAGEFGALAIVVAAIFLTEATLLVLRVWWATYLMIGLTALGLPFEIARIFQRPASLRHSVVLTINVAILAYLWWRRNDLRKANR